jgi:hypothetical protein
MAVKTIHKKSIEYIENTGTNTTLIFKEIYCSDCKMVLARYSTKYFTDANINVLVRLHFFMHIRNGHSIETRLVEMNGQQL